MNKSELARQAIRKNLKRAAPLSQTKVTHKMVKDYPSVFKSFKDADWVVRSVSGAIGKKSTAGPIQATAYHKEVRDEKRGIKITSDKKESNFHWRDPLKHLQGLQQVFKQGKDSQDEAFWKIESDSIVVVAIGDLHAGSWATDYDLFVKITEEIINTPNLYVILLGDLLQMAIKLRGVLEVSDNALPPKWQMRFLESWLMDIKHKVICSTWDNHSVMREENASGFSQYANIFSKHVIYHDNIGHIDVHVNNQVYKLAVAHFFRGRTMYNPVHGQMRYMRMTQNDREITAAGDSHTPGFMWYEEGGKERLALNCGSIQNSGFGKRLFTLKNSPVFPCLWLSGVQKEAIVFKTVNQALRMRA